MEPFCGSAAVLFLRPNGAGRVETINDADGMCANFWRSLKHDPDAVADAADFIVSEVDLHARHLWLVGQRARITERMMADPEFCDPKAAGYWAWASCLWIGSGFCSGDGPWGVVDGEFGKLPSLRNTGQGVHRKLPHLGDTGKGVHRKLPHLGNTGQGVHRQLPHLGDTGKGDDAPIGRCAERTAWLCGYLRKFADRLRDVRVCCGDWSRVLTPSVTFRHGVTGVFLDPPYPDSAERCEDVYAVDDLQVAHAAREWAIEHGARDDMRIVLCGYEGQHEMPKGWRAHRWKAVGGYGLTGDDEAGTGRTNRARECLWFSPFCELSSQSLLF